jgi:hypothetical protein
MEQLRKTLLECGFADQFDLFANVAAADDAGRDGFAAELCFASQALACPIWVKLQRLLPALAVAEHGIEGANQLASAGPQLTDALLDDAIEHALAFGKKRNEHFSTIFFASGAAHITVAFEAVHELDRAVMPDQQAVGERLNLGGRSVGHSANRQQQQVLLGFESGRARGCVAFAKKEADAVTQFRHGLVFGRSDSLHRTIISWNDRFREGLAAEMTSNLPGC